ncbi:Protein of unknown function [Cotesia congregata]|uniref:Uncharacterized protein n=1 Tax=Cotesia congregata TaxID=51543 RepID=A0A8J2HRL4_COTCN|nr:Protein of unknown function [Cotesia congregata]
MESRERYDELCRLCASYDAVKMDIFGQEGKNRQLVDKIQTCLPFKQTFESGAAGSAIKSQHGDGGRGSPRGARDVVERVERGAVNECRCKGRGGAAGTGVILARSRERGRRLPSARATALSFYFLKFC